MPISNWDDVRIFLAVARAGGLIAAGRRLNLDQTTVARRISALEAAFGARLIERSSRGVSLTGHGMGLIEHAERMEVEALTAGEQLDAAGQGVAGVVRLATPEVFGSSLVAPAAAQLRALHPNLQLELVPAARTVNLSRREADIVIGLSRPEHGRLVAMKLADYRLGLYASRAYLDQAGVPARLEDLKARPLVWYIDEMLDLPELRYLDQVADGAQTVFRSSSIAAQQAALVSGIGLGVLPVFLAGKTPELVRVMEDQLTLTRSYWLSMHVDSQRMLRVRAVVEFLQALVTAHRPAL
ncbi:MAG: LysR family transcriptional regulator [Caulobacteraceae bacterium]|nr:LysR family transcriptional regulator [Caulobacteraceae bacterium]